ncbi:hypothetical protein AB0N09_41755 [Streptomyces erythrochromogenes]|uniref:hypothetical protein n=1 Tax=Streptomyces erythrochromogenes TaxID=285574 RepID=UPI003420A583
MCALLRQAGAVWFVVDDARWRMPSMRAVMESRERAAPARVEEPRAESERVRAALADAEEVLNRRVIGLEEYLETLIQRGGPEPAEASRRVVHHLLTNRLRPGRLARSRGRESTARDS